MKNVSKKNQPLVTSKHKIEASIHEQNHIDEKKALEFYDVDDVHYPCITPCAPSGPLFALSVRPRTPATRLLPRLVGPQGPEHVLRLPPMCVPDNDMESISDEKRNDVFRSLRTPLSGRKTAKKRSDFSLCMDRGRRSTCETNSFLSPGLSYSPPVSPHRSSSSSIASVSSPPPSTELAEMLKLAGKAADTTRIFNRSEWRAPHAPLTAPNHILEAQFLGMTSLHSPPPPRLPPLGVSRLNTVPAANPLSSVRLPSSDPVVVFPVHCGLHSLAAATLDPRPRLAVSTSRPPTAMLYDEDPVTHVRGVDAMGGDPACIVAATPHTVAIATLSDTSLCFRTAIDAQILDAAVSSWTHEVALLTRSGLRLGHSEVFQPAEVRDVHPLLPRAAYSTISYTSHPRILLLSGALSIATVDLRVQDSSPSIRLSIDEWRLPQYGSNFSVVHPVQGAQFHVVGCTPSLLAYFDIRSPAEPLLRLSYEMPMPVSLVATTRMPVSTVSSDVSCDVLAFAAPFHHYLSIAHVIHQPRPHCSLSSFSGISAQLPDPSIVWGDEPMQMDNFLPESSSPALTGLTIVPSDQGQMHVAHWSSSSGLTALPFRLTNDESMEESLTYSNDFVDQKYIHQVATSRGERRNDIGSTLDSSVRIANRRRALLSQGISVHAEDRELRPISRSVGTQILEKTFRLPLNVALRTRDCIASSIADEFCEGVRVPRVDMSGLAFDTIHENGSVNTNKTNLLEALKTSPMLLHDVTCVVRTGNSHTWDRTPLIDSLSRALEASPFVSSEKVVWHEGCNHRHRHRDMIGSVATDGDIPDWVDQHVYFKTPMENLGCRHDHDEGNHEDLYDEFRRKSSVGDADIDQGGVLVPRDSGIGKLMRRMHSFFFDKTGD